MTKKKRRGIIGMLVVIAILGAGYAAIKTINERAEEAVLSEAEEDVIEIVSLDTEAIESFSYYYIDEEEERHLLTFEKEDDTWLCTSAEAEEDIELDETILETMLSNTAPLNAVRLVSESADDLSEYGLDEPGNEFVFCDSDGKETVLFIGTENVTTGDYYIREQDSSTVYAVTSSFITAFDYSLEDLTIADEDEDEDEDADEDEEIDE